MNSLNNLEAIAQENVHGNVATIEGIKNRLITWFCITLNTTPTDTRLLDMTIEELIVFYLSHKIYHDPHYKSQADKDEYEEWLKKQMADNYVSEDEMIKEQVQAEKEQQEAYEHVKAKYPEKITTDFEKVEQGE